MVAMKLLGSLLLTERFGFSFFSIILTFVIIAMEGATHPYDPLAWIFRRLGRCSRSIRVLYGQKVGVESGSAAREDCRAISIRIRPARRRIEHVRR